MTDAQYNGPAYLNFVWTDIFPNPCLVLGIGGGAKLKKYKGRH